MAMPVFAPLFTPGTERVEVRWLTVDVPVAAEIAARCLPPGLGVPELPSVGLWIAEFIGAEFHSPTGVERRPNYHQGGLSLRCTGFGGGPDGAYAIETFVEGLNHGILGRELFGLPKKQALQVQLDERGEQVHFGITSALGHQIVEGTADLDAAAGDDAVPGPVWFDRHYTVKAIPSAEGTGYDICKLVEIPWSMTPSGAVRQGHARLEWGVSATDPVHVFESAGPAQARYGHAILDIRFGRYLGDVEPPEPLGEPSWNPETR
ncbi:hypothetical protein DCE94_04805 [Agromyces badenianii]|nr:hypothetical protein DCE94_04805 [Agromyces badenianii]